MEFKIGDKVVLQTPLKGLPENSIGEIASFINDELVSVIYKQHLPIDKGNGKYEFTKYVYLHSANINEIKLV